MSEPTRKIPEPIKREVRQRCGFGCVVCGAPIYQYEHMVEWADAHTHNASEITLLCGSHHDERTRGMLSKQTVAEANDNPVNVKNGWSNPYNLDFKGSKCSMLIGTNRSYTNHHGMLAFLTIDGMPVVGFRLVGNDYFLNIDLRDRDNQTILRVIDNELIYSSAPWDISFTGSVLAIRERAGRFFVELKFGVPNQIEVTRAHFVFNGVEIIVRPTYLLLLNSCQQIRQVSGDSPIAIAIGATPPGQWAFMGWDVPRKDWDRDEMVDYAVTVLGIPAADLKL